MPNDHEMSASLAYRKNEAAIIRGEVPEKYLRLLPHIVGERILEIGSAEGVLALLLAKKGKNVVALERSPERHSAAEALAEKWGVQNVNFINGDIRDRLAVPLLTLGIDTLVAVRMIYYLGDGLDTVFAEAAQKVPNVVLCGNKNRAQWWRDGVPNRNDRADNYYASHEGMTALLERHGYKIKTVIKEGDPIVVASR